MIRVTLPDGSVKEFAGAVTARQVAESIGPRLAQAAVGAKIDGELRDLSAVIDRDCRVAIVTEKTRDGRPDPDALYLLRHSAAHVMAEAIQRIVPGAQLVYGPPLETGFYYDIRFPDDRPLKEGDFEAVEAEMAKIVKEDRRFTRYELPAEEGLAKLRAEGSKYKVDNAERALRGGEKGGETHAPPGGGVHLSWYATGEPGRNWEDLCRGPHLPSTGRIGAFKVMSLASSYWHGDENSDRLTRVYGTAFFSKKDLDEHLTRLEEAKKRDHRVIGKQLRLFHIDEMVGQGLVLWTPRGSIVRKELQSFIGEELRKQGYFEVFSPHVGKLDLYRTSGHFPYYAESQFPPVVERESLAALAAEGCSCAEYANRLSKGEIEGYLLKPMNCPHHIKIFASEPHSYRDMPVRLAEFGTVYRWEQSGELSGMLRVRCFTQDDAHLFCTPEQVGREVLGCLELVKVIFATLGMKEYRVRVGLRDPDSAKYVGKPENWDRAEASCREAALTLGVPFTEEPGEAAFYGPKIDFVVKDVIGREWQLGTVQVDYNLPERFDLSYIGADNKPHRPVMIHRAPFGSMERFVGFLIEHFAGAFPAWLSPEQVRVLPVSEKTEVYAKRVLAALVGARVRATADLANERLQAKIRHAAEEKVPYLLVVGPRDEEAGTVSVRARGVQQDLGAMGLTEFVVAITREIASRGAETATAHLV
ncbi:MAG: threonine--tRNA ligase [Leptolyngbya sp. PLA2]|nr:threonine--tRNA ligase [Leptolyngbya sp. PL-A2]MCQ3940472.1 threonine--tRNA ligase [cyanobacterium CYA1]MDL1904322.1 threonine--tRNA ligase [Synechococcales cyanobacterium CNB]